MATQIHLNKTATVNVVLDGFATGAVFDSEDPAKFTVTLTSPASGTSFTALLQPTGLGTTNVSFKAQKPDTSFITGLLEVEIIPPPATAIVSFTATEN
jgi:hypothetical protein